jgi:hypothetical protein
LVLSLKARQRPDRWTTMTRIVTLLAKLVGLAELIRRAFM